jgi:hypothetical protein
MGVNLMSDWITEVIEKRAMELQGKINDNGWFSITAISNVPYIAYPNLTKEQCFEIQEQTKNVLRISRNENQFQEVAITYSLNDQSKDKYKKILGNFDSIIINDDPNTQELFKKANEKKDLIIISIHNHPNDSPFSITDLLLFCENPSIKIMEIVNRQGEVSFLLRPIPVRYTIVTDNILDVEPSYITKVKTFKVKYPESKIIKISDIIENKKIRQNIFEESLIELQSKGVFYSKYVGNDKKDSIDFNVFYNASQLDNKENDNLENSNGIQTFNSDIVYLENGEDGYEWEER